MDKALAECGEVRTVLVSRRTGGSVTMTHGRDVWLEHLGSRAFGSGLVQDSYRVRRE